MPCGCETPGELEPCFWLGPRAPWRLCERPFLKLLGGKVSPAPLACRRHNVAKPQMVSYGDKITLEVNNHQISGLITPLKGDKITHGEVDYYYLPPPS